MNDYLLSDLFIEWYNTHHRDLPWRNTRNPYLIWVSEIILQQTRVEQGLEYYKRFIERFPDISSLAQAPLQEVLLYWQGLGYYSRARNLQAAAQQVMSCFGGVFPEDYESIRSLKGIGPYTAAAVASFAFGKPYAVLDGNVFRVLARLLAMNEPIDTAKGRKRFQQAADLLMNPSCAALHNQSVMEFGALQCTPGQPDCSLCPLSSHCGALMQGLVSGLPVKQGKPKVRDRWFYYFYIEMNGQTYLHQRLNQDIWSHLYEFPMLETDEYLDFGQLSRHPSFQRKFSSVESMKIEPVLLHKKHVLSHQCIHADFYRVVLSRPLEDESALIRIEIANLNQYPVSRLMRYCLDLL